MVSIRLCATGEMNPLARCK